MSERTMRRGIAIPMVLIVGAALLFFVSTLLFSSRSQRGTHTLLLDQTRALMAAKGIMQLALYKFRVLPSEFYVLEGIRLAPPPPPPGLEYFQMAWMDDFNTKNPGSPAPAKILVQLLQQADGRTYDVGIEKMEMVTKVDSGYKKDYLRIEAWGSCNGQKKTIEEFVEVEVTHD